ncbi:hypothetical protein LIPSTDRAFT_103977 [Lipomyces starkeyi NRRL Y-11557]|uniref:HAT C-terminal dimerisation domain-containing protein n=1 Tax=Lipomyces starkeyi NRRL Y-11557 TaxID=675824 RepID=A0A1E3Q6Z7_LIPST|nr:hypothetical protein LIPSTDRAFT_103977 [Lipomyces starkeyi NRRL Y-11557]
MWISQSAEKFDSDPLQWFFSKQHQYPRIAGMARDFLAIPASSVPSERVFSIGGNLITAKRTRLGDKTIEASMCLKSWGWAGPVPEEQNDSDTEEAAAW